MLFIKRLLPEWLLKVIRPFYHGAVALAANFYFGRPSRKITVVGITGTTGKSTTAAMLAKILNFAGKKCGYITTINFFDGNIDRINKHGLSMPGGWLLQKQLATMLKNGCVCAVVECTSEGLAQNRHLGIGFDVALLTNVSSAHLEAHGGFENYKKAKKKLFQAVSVGKKPEKVLGANIDSPYAENFLEAKAKKKFGVSFSGKNLAGVKTYQAKITGQNHQVEFVMDGVSFLLPMVGIFNAYNAALAAACANFLGVDLPAAAAALKVFGGIRGRMEPVSNNRGLEIFVDYGCEPASFEAALKAAVLLPHKKFIHVFGSTGGHRDASKRFIFGQTSAQFADKIIITNDDVYDSNPERIVSDIEGGIKASKRYTLYATRYEKVLDRREAIAKALFVAQQGDLVLITGKGSEQFLVLPGNKRISWDEVSVVREELAKLDIKRN